mmetsp:Transcript_10066/g.21788  ORF Transcript_10066/g.21788 Transcript_10066/m.21788 type:complete len:221 (+) Transcript_10066:410-1072(+)
MMMMLPVVGGGFGRVPAALRRHAALSVLVAATDDVVHVLRSTSVPGGRVGGGGGRRSTTGGALGVRVYWHRGSSLLLLLLLLLSIIATRCTPTSMLFRCWMLLLGAGARPLSLVVLLLLLLLLLRLRRFAFLRIWSRSSTASWGRSAIALFRGHAAPHHAARFFPRWRRRRHRSAPRFAPRSTLNFVAILASPSSRVAFLVAGALRRKIHCFLAFHQFFF